VSTTRDELSRAAEAALEHAGAQALATAWTERTLRAGVEDSRVAAVRAIERHGVDVLAVADGHTARASAPSLDPDAVAEAARRARASAEALAGAAGAPGDHPGPPEPSTPRGHDGFDVATARLDDALWQAPLTTALAAAAEAGATLDGHWSASAVTSAVAATSGLRGIDAVTDASLRLAVRAGGSAERTAVAAGRLDAAALVAEALAGTPNGTPLTTLPPGDYDVVLGPDAVAQVLWILARTAFNGLLFAEGRGPLAGMLGTRVAAPPINLSDTPRFPATLPRAFDAEGVPKAPIPLIQDGVAHRVVHDVRSAARTGNGAASTGHALAPGGAPTGPEPRNFVLVGGGAEDERELARPIERGAYLPHLSGVELLDLATATFTAVANGGARLIENGEISGPLAPIRLTVPALDVLARTQALGRRNRLVGRVETFDATPRFASGAVVPPLRARALPLS